MERAIQYCMDGEGDSVLQIHPHAVFIELRASLAALDVHFQLCFELDCRIPPVPPHHGSIDIGT